MYHVRKAINYVSNEFKKKTVQKKKSSKVHITIQSRKKLSTRIETRVMNYD